MRRICGYEKNIDNVYRANNLGLHCHCAENKEKLLVLLEMAKKENVGVLIVNNYKSLKVYTEVLPMLSEKEIKPYEKIKMVPAIEMPANFNFTNIEGQNYNIEVHILGYGVDIEKEKMLEEFCRQKYKTIDQEQELQRLKKIGHEIGLVFDDDDVYIDKEDDNRKFAGRAFMQALMKNIEANFCKDGEENDNKMPYELRTNWRAFQNRCVKSLNSPFYLDMGDLNPDVSEVIELIHEMGGVAYLAHPSAYFAKVGTKDDVDVALKNVEKFANDFITMYSPKNNTIHIDGAEVYHPSYIGNMEIISEVDELVREHRIGSSGGTDIHVDKTLGKDETVSGDSLGGKVTKKKLRKYRLLRDKAIAITELRKVVIRKKRDVEER